MNILKKVLLVGVSVASLAFMAGCSYGPGLISSVDVKPEEAKIGKAACRSIFFIPFGKCTIGKAAENGKLSQIQSVDYKYFNILIYSSKTVEVRGK
ncbi:hypothetical protein CQA53_01695 [Helicobacter didelphidarum]|uniref:Lipoprotein n=1 Tax=Helicobacter didelphidarum TaxID=2040648 RepID=A0A3D8IPG2_9HELI|nr:TRL domain-containing protein [Helicobacter didelphidarum]RDU67003.1 hypothetical protein CQA53_01695 [Helicobacter didelphidarum]